MEIERLLKIIDEEEDNYTYGGDEDEEGTLMSGQVDFDKIRNAVKALTQSTKKLN